MDIGASPITFLHAKSMSGVEKVCFTPPLTVVHEAFTAHLLRLFFVFASVSVSAEAT